MDTGKRLKRDSDKHELVLKKEVFSVVGCALEVLNTLGHGLFEKSYENAMVVEFGSQDIPFVQQPHYEVVYKGVKIGDYIPDLVVFGKIVVEMKTIERIGNHEKGQMLNYLKLTGLKVGLILNFKYSKLDWQRFVL